MSDIEIEKLKLQIQREQNRADLLKWFVVFIWPLVVNVATAYVNNRAIGSVAAKADTAATAASTAAKVAVETKNDQGEKLSAIATKADVLVVQGDAGNKSWLAFETKDPADKDAAVKAVVNAERMTEQMPVVIPK